MPGIRFGRLLLLITLASAAVAAPPLTNIRDTLVLANGQTFSGVLQIDWKSFRAVDGTEIPQNFLNVTVVNGAINLRLVPTTNADRPAYYTVRYNSGGRVQFTENWSVPQTTATLRVADVRTHAPSPGGGGVSDPLTAIDVQDVNGLRTELDLRPARGATWVPRRTAMIGDSGAIEAVIGAADDCVRVDGSSGPCGQPGNGIIYVDNETPAGLLDGVNTVFQLSRAPFPVGSLALFRNGTLARSGESYTLNGSTITFAPGRAPYPGDLLTASYRIDPADAVGTVHSDLETPVGVINGVNLVFTLAATPVPAASLQVFRNGILQKSGVDYTQAVNQLQFLPVSVPRTGDILQVMYRK